MARKLPDDPTKKRLQIFKRCYQNLEHWEALREDRGMSDIITCPDGEEIYLPDLMVGKNTLPPRQWEAFELICLKGYTQEAAREVMLPNSRSSTPVQQYADSGLVRMVAQYDEQQARTIWTRWRSIMSAGLHQIIRQGLQQTRKDILSQLDDLKLALSQIDKLLSAPEHGSLPPQQAKVSQQVKMSPFASTASTATLQGKPDLDAIARSMVDEEKATSSA